MMKLTLACFLLLFNFESSCGIFKAPQDIDNENNSYKILNGFAKMQFPYTVKIFSRDNRKTLLGFSCSGSIIHKLWIITAAHCVFSFKVFDVFIGNVTNDKNHVVSATQVFIHPNFTFDPELLNDLALMKLKTSLDALNNTFEIVSLPQRSDVGKSFVGLQGVVAGFGRMGDSGPTATSPDWARYEILSLKECQNFFKRNFTDYSERIICGRGVRASTCQGDSGQALVISRKGKRKIVGIVSNGYESCETLNEPEMFTRVDGYLNFIKDIMGTY